MALATAEDCKDYLRIETNAEDSLIDRLLEQATAAIEAELGYPIVATERTHTDFSELDNHGIRPSLSLPGPFKLTAPAPVVTDVDGITIAAADYTLDARGMRMLANRGVAFPNRPYTVVATIGLSVHPDYASRLQAVVSQALVDLVAHLYQNRNPGVNNESDEGGTSRTYSSIGSPALIPKRIMDAIDTLPGRNGGMVLA